MSNQDQIEREQRISATIEVGARLPSETDNRTAKVCNISDGGLLLVGDEIDREPGDSIAVEIPATDTRGRVLVLTQVAWIDNGRKGLKVQGMMPHHRARYRELLDQLAVAA